MAQTLDVGVTVGEAPFTDPATGATGTGCQVTATGTGEQFRNPQGVVSRLGSMLERQGWKNDPMLVADGPTGTASGFRKEDQVCVAGARWQPDASANCPDRSADLDLSGDARAAVVHRDPGLRAERTTQRAGRHRRYGQSGFCELPSAGRHAVHRGRGDGGQIGVCYFEDNRQCEEWALMRGECPVGGVKVTGYVTPAGRYCAITGGNTPSPTTVARPTNRAPAPSRTHAVRRLGLLQRQV